MAGDSLFPIPLNPVSFSPTPKILDFLNTPPQMDSQPPQNDQNTPPLQNQANCLKSQHHPISGSCCKNTAAPERLIVPKAFKYPERYTSPTDKMMSPVSRGILARRRKGRKLMLPPSANRSKVQFPSSFGQSIKIDSMAADSSPLELEEHNC